MLSKISSILHDWKTLVDTLDVKNASSLANNVNVMRSVATYLLEFRLLNRQLKHAVHGG